MRAAAYQPQYFPRLHYFNRILDSDVFVVLDSAQYIKALKQSVDGRQEKHKSYQSDSPIYADAGAIFLTVPTKKGGYQPLRETQIQYDNKWQHKHIKALQNAYAKTPGSNRWLPEITDLIMHRYSSLAELNLATIMWGIARVLGDTRPVGDLSLEYINSLLSSRQDITLNQIVLDSETGVVRPLGRQKGTEWTSALCLHVGADEYMYGGTAQAGYMDLDYYRQQGIEPVLQNWKLKPYPQKFETRHGFIPNLSIIDLLMNVAPEEALDRLFPEQLPAKARP